MHLFTKLGLGWSINPPPTDFSPAAITCTVPHPSRCLLQPEILSPSGDVLVGRGLLYTPLTWHSRLQEHGKPLGLQPDCSPTFYT